MVRQTGALPLLLSCAATVAAGGALTADVAHGTHPTHSVVLGVVAVVGASLRRLGHRTVAAFPAVSAALAAEPVLHLTSETVGPQMIAPDHRNLVQHLPLSEVPAASEQIAVPALAIVAATVGAHLLYLLIDAVRRRLAASARSCAPPHVLIQVRARRLGSMLRWCGWVLQAAQRGPPAVPAYVIS